MNIIPTWAQPKLKTFQDFRNESTRDGRVELSSDEATKRAQSIRDRVADLESFDNQPGDLDPLPLAVRYKIANTNIFEQVNISRGEDGSKTVVGRALDHTGKPYGTGGISVDVLTEDETWSVALNQGPDGIPSGSYIGPLAAWDLPYKE